MNGFEFDPSTFRERAQVVQALAAVKKAGMDHIGARFEQTPNISGPTKQAYTYLTDCIVELALMAAQKLANVPSIPGFSVVAVGGYGRGEMAPYSDVDLLFLSEGKITADTSATVEALLYILWDLKYKVGHATRSTAECIKLAREDYTIRTSLVEMRHLLGDAGVTTRLAQKLDKDLFSGTAPDFIDAKLSERAERHIKQGGQRYVVEPNVKEGKGGLRDLQSLYWIGKYVNHVTDTADLVKIGVFHPEEYQAFQKAEEFLWAVRSHLHLIAGRAVEQLTFDMQITVAQRMGYKDKKGRRAVEQFMQDYFRHATLVGEITRIFLTAMEAQHAKNEPSLMRFFARKKKVKDPFAVVRNRLTIADDAAFLNDPLNILRLFEEALRTGYLIDSDAMRLVKSNLHLIDDNMRGSKEAVRIFMDLMLKHANPERALRRMNELGVLAAFIPEFEPIVAMMQFNLYHSYTVDEHTIQTISHLAKIEREELVEELPIASGILKEGVNRKTLYVALLMHDIGKGQEEDHSILGAKISRKVTPRLRLTKAESKDVEWLVRNHLVMSDVAQKRDLSDPRTVRDFAKAMGTVKRLDLLTVLTVCDISGVGPGVWNNWKATLIRSLYSQTRAVLENGFEDIARQNKGKEARKKLRKALADWPEKEVRKETARHYPPYWQGLHVTTQTEFAQMLRGIAEDEIRVSLIDDPDRDATRAQFAMVDHPGVFSRITGTLAVVGANIVDARSYTTKDGYVTAVFWVQDKEGTPYGMDRVANLERMINKSLKGEVITRDAVQKKDKIKRREKPFRVPTTISFDNEGSEIYTIIEVDTRDRPGLLYDLTRSLHSMNVNIASAIIATYGEQVVDTFYVKDMFGLKYHSEQKRDYIKQNLCEAITLGTQKAFS
ncbi:MAG: [protein-PII] uridylyltransferase [Planktomarina sp.]